MRRECLAIALLVLGAATPAVAAPRKYTVGAEVQGAVTARFTLRRAVRFPLDMDSSRPSDLYGMILTRVGDKQSFFVGASVDGRRPIGYGAIGQVVDHAGLVWPPGTYDLILFSPTRTRVNLYFENPMPRLQFRARKLQLVRRDSTSSNPVWSDQVDLTISGPWHGLFVFQRDEWNGMRRHMQDYCVWHTAPCVPADEDQLLDGTNDSGAQEAESRSLMGGAVFADGLNHVSLASITGGTATHRTAVVLVIP